MNPKNLFPRLILALLIIFGLGLALSPTQAAVLDPLTAVDIPKDPQMPQAPTPRWNLLYIDGLQNEVNKGDNASLAFDLTNNTPYITYYSYQTQNLVLASPSSSGNCGGGKWWCRDVDSTGDVGLGSSLAIHDKVSTVGGKLGISYYDATFKRLKFVQWACTSSTVCNWTFYNFLLGPDIDGGRQSSLQYNSLGEPQIAYFMNWNNPITPISSIKFCKWVGSGGNEAGGAFTCTDIIRKPLMSGVLYPSLAINPMDEPRIAFYDAEFGNLAYARYVPSGGQTTCYTSLWHCYYIDEAGIVGNFPSLEMIEVNGVSQAHIAYYDATNGKLKHAYSTTLNGNCGWVYLSYAWKCDIVDTMGTGITWPAISLSLDELGNPYIAYQDYLSEPSRLKLARLPGPLGIPVGNCGTAPPILGPYQCDVIDWGGHNGAETFDGFFPSIARSSSGLINIAYKEYDYFYNSGTLKLAYENLWSFLPQINKDN